MGSKFPLLAARSLPPILFPLFPIPKSQSFAVRLPRLSTLKSRDFELLKCCAVSKKSSLQSDESADELSDDDKEGDEARKQPKIASKRSRKRTLIPAAENSEVDGITAVGNFDGDEQLDDQSLTILQKKKITSRRGRKKTTPMYNSEEEDDSAATTTADTEEESMIKVALPKNSRKTKRKASKQAAPTTDEAQVAKRHTRKKSDMDLEAGSSTDLSDTEEMETINIAVLETEEVLHMVQEENEDISFSYAWPPLVCCFGAAQHSFVPSGRPSNRLIDYDIHETMKDMFWTPERFVRAPGGSSSSVAVALASLGGRVAFMGKVGDDEYGQSMLYHLNINNVQTRAMRIDDNNLTSISYMKISRRGGFKTTPVRPCAEDSLLSSEISIDVLKEAKMFYFNSSSLLDTNMRITTMQAIQTSKKLGGVVFYDVNLPLPLWQARDDTVALILEAWNFAGVIEVTKQELEFLCGIEPTENFDTKDNDRSKFTHYRPEVILPLWHDNLKVLFVTNGTSKIHYYTKNNNGWVNGMEDAPITPFTCDMSTSGDGVVAAIMRMLSVQPDLITDEGYLRHTIKYAIDCGVIDQWLVARMRGFPPKEGMDEVSSITEREYRTVSPDVD